MTDNATSSDKTTGFSMNPATVELNDGTIIDAAHHIVNDDAQLLHLYLDGRDGGIDVTVPLADSEAKAWAQTAAGRRALGIDTDADDQDADDRAVADGGRDIPSCECGADLVRTAELTTAEAPVAGARYPVPSMRTVPDAECSNCGRSVGAMYGTQAAVAVWDARGESPPGDGGRLMTDGGIPGHTNRSQANGHKPVRKDVEHNGDEEDDDVEDSETDVETCTNPLCDADATESSKFCSPGCRVVVREARCIADARDGYDSLLMPSADRATVGAVLAALNRGDEIGN